MSYGVTIPTPVTYHWVLTLLTGTGRMATRVGTYTPPAGTDRQHAYTTVLETVREQLGPEFANSCVSHWSLDRNEL